jgi:hypothetical protein
MRTPACNPSLWEAEAGERRVGGQPGLGSVPIRSSLALSGASCRVVRTLTQEAHMLASFQQTTE